MVINFFTTPPTLQKTFELAGFKEIRYLKVTDDTDPVFRQAEFGTNHPVSEVRIMNNWEAMAFEATR